MLSMAATAAFLPFLPLLPMQILLLNFLSDIPATSVSTDRVDPEQLGQPSRWDVRLVRTFMIVFGLVSTVFDLITFAVLRWGFGAGPELFRTGWFIESTATELAALLVLRTRRPFVRSRPGTALAATSLAVLVIVVALPFTPLVTALGLTSPSAGLLGALAAITVGYVVATEWCKHRLPRLLGTGVAVAGLSPGTARS
jgi:Mg2+-importing ATPase